MKIDSFFTLSAGLGSRMGDIGSILPKPLWPVFEKTLLELQFDFYQWLGIEKNFINTHFQAPKIHDFIKRKKLMRKFYMSLNC